MMNRFAALMFLWVSFDAVISFVASNPTGTDDTESLSASISLFLYSGGSYDEYTEVMVGHELDLINKVDISKRTVLYIHGWMENPNMTSVKTTIVAYLRRQDHNVILVNWSKVAAGHYFLVAPKVGSVGRAVAKGLNDMVAAGLDPTTLHIVGHSLGSHVAGFIGRNVNFTLPRITGLDPAGPGFYFLIDDLTSADAEFVDVIHTDAGVYGTTENHGNVSFFPNGGTRFQPGCPIIRTPLRPLDEFCDHQRSWGYYAESLLKEDAFIGVQCDSYIAFKLGFCKSNTRVVMGYGTPTTASGNFHLTTNSESPYGKGQDGV